MERDLLDLLICILRIYIRKNVRELKSASSVIGDTPSSLKNESKYYWFYFDQSCSLSLDGKAEMVRVAESDLIFSDAVPVWTDPNTGREYPVDLRAD